MFKKLVLLRIGRRGEKRRQTDGEEEGKKIDGDVAKTHLGDKEEKKSQQ